MLGCGRKEMLEQIKEEKENIARKLWKNIVQNNAILFSQIAHIYSYGIFLAMYLWFIFFDILALHIIILSLILGVIAIGADLVIFVKLKNTYYDTFNFGKTVVIFVIFYIFQVSYFMKGWLNIEPQQIMLGYLIGYSQLKATGMLAIILKSVGTIALILSFISCLSYANAGYSKVIPGWNKKIVSGEFVFLSFIVATINIIAALLLSSNIKGKSGNAYILVSFFVLASLLIIPTYKERIRVFAEESPETRRMLRMFKSQKTIIIVDSSVLMLTNIALLTNIFIEGVWGIIAVILSVALIIVNRVRLVGTAQKEKNEEEIELITKKIFQLD